MRTLSFLLAFALTTTVLGDAAAEVTYSKCALYSAAAVTPVAALSSIMPVAALSGRDASFGTIFRNIALVGVGAGALSMGLCSAYVAEPRTIPATMTGLGLGLSALMFGGVWAGSRENYESFHPTPLVWLGTGAAVAVGGAAGYFLGDDSRRANWLTIAPLAGGVLGQLVFMGSHLRALPECFGGDDCGDRELAAYRIRRDGLIGIGIGALLGTAVGIIGAAATPRVMPTVDGNGTTMTTVGGVF